MIDTIKDMKPAAARLLLVYLLMGRAVDEWPKRRVMELSGIHNETKYYEARRELVAAGFLVRTQEEYILSSSLHIGASDSLRSPLSINQSISSASIVDDSLRSPSPVDIDRYINNIYIQGSADQPVEPFRENCDPTGLTPQVTERPAGSLTDPTGHIPDVGTDPTGHSLTPQVIYPSRIEIPQVSPLSLLDRCMDADAMDASGDRMQRTSPFQARRRAQIPLVQEAWSHFYPKAGKLTEANARSFLSWSGDSVVFVHDQMARVAERKPDLQSPLGYLSKVLPNEYTKRNQPISSASPSRPAQPAEDEELYKPTDEELQKMKEQSKKYASLFPNED